MWLYSLDSKYKLNNLFTSDFSAFFCSNMFYFATSELTGVLDLCVCAHCLRPWLRNFTAATKYLNSPLLVLALGFTLCTMMH